MLDTRRRHFITLLGGRGCAGVGNPQRQRYRNSRIRRSGACQGERCGTFTDAHTARPSDTGCGVSEVNLSGMTVEALMDLRKRVDETLHKRRAEIEKQLERMDRAIAVVGGARVVRGGGSVLNGDPP